MCYVHYPLSPLPCSPNRQRADILVIFTANTEMKMLTGHRIMYIGEMFVNKEKVK